MKNFNLLKKIGSAFTAVAMLASVGTVAFAEKWSEDDSVQITEITCNESDTAGVYDVNVTCQVATDKLDANTIGVTMLTYAKHGESLALGTDGPTPYANGMQIVGIDQQVKESDGKVIFTFAVTTDTSNGNEYYMNQGEAAVILVSGDGLNPAAGLLTIPKEKTNVTATEIYVSYDAEIEAFSYDTVASIKGKLIASLADSDVYVDVYGLVENNGIVVGNVKLDSSWITAVEKNEAVYTATVTVPAGTTVTSDEYNVTIESALTCEFAINTIPTPWAADTVALKGGNALEIPAADVVAEQDILDFLADKDVVISDSTNADAKVEIKVADAVTPDAENPTEYTEGKVFKYTIAVADDANGAYTVPENSVIEVTVTIVAKAEPEFDKGDINQDDHVAATDISALIKMIAETDLTDADAGTDEFEKLDFNGDGHIAATDISALIRYVADYVEE